MSCPTYGLNEHEVVVLGGGPAGCAAATLLALRSHRVALVRPTAPAAGALAESVPPSARGLLAELGLLEAVETAAFHPNRGNTVWWAGGAERREAFPEGQYGVHVDRQGLEDALVPAAARLGVRVYDGMMARRVEREGGVWRIRCETTGPAMASDVTSDGASNPGPVDLVAPWVLDATGRHGLLARGEGRVPDRSTTTVALVRRFRRRSGWGAEHVGHTWVESYVDGWAWSVPLDKDVRCFTAMVDHRHVSLEGAGVDGMLEAELAKAPRLSGPLAGAEPLGQGWACPASLYTATRFARDGLLLVGDAGSFIDPLSSYGVKKALSSGWMAGVATHTALVDPKMRAIALDFFDAREHEVYRRYRRASAAFFEEAANAYGHEYWAARAQAARAAGGEGTEGADPDTYGPAEVPEAAVRAAFEALRTREQLDAIPGTSLRVVDRPAIEGHRITRAPHLVSELHPGGLRWVRGVDLHTVVEHAPLHQNVPELWTTYNAVATPVPLPDFLTALSTAFAAGFLAQGGG